MDKWLTIGAPDGVDPRFETPANQCQPTICVLKIAKRRLDAMRLMQLLVLVFVRHQDYSE
jgi:hypothetical protein